MVANGIANKAIDPKNVQPHIQAVTQALQTDPTGGSAKPIGKQISDMLIANSPKQTELATSARQADTSAQQLNLARDRFNAEKPKIQAEGQQAQTQQALQELSSIDNQDQYSAWLQRNPFMKGRGAFPMYSPGGKAALLRQAVPVKDQPQFDIDTQKARMGIMGNGEYDQFLGQYARSLGKTPAQLTPEEGLKSFQVFAEQKQDPVMRANAIAQSNLAVAMN